MRLVSVEMLTPDMELAFPVYFKNALVINKGRNHIDQYSNNFRNMGINFVYVHDELSEGIKVDDVIEHHTRVECKDAVKKVMESYQSNSTMKVNQLQQAIDLVISDVLNNKDVQLSLNDISTVDEYTYVHSVNVAVYSALIGEKLGYSSKQLAELTMGAVLHDIGKTVIPLEVQMKLSALTDQEFEIMKRHAEYGYEILGEIHTMSQGAKEVSHCHHEKLNGTGYPRGLKENEISEYARIVSIADVYDALTSDRCYRRKWSAQNAMNYLVEKSGTELDAGLVQLFIQKIAVYPNGSMVRLSDGMVGIIERQNTNTPLRPVVRVCYDQNLKEITPYEVDMMKILSITILSGELEIDIKKARETL